MYIISRVCVLPKKGAYWPTGGSFGAMLNYIQSWISLQNVWYKCLKIYFYYNFPYYFVFLLSVTQKEIFYSFLVQISNPTQNKKELPKESVRSKNLLLGNRSGKSYFKKAYQDHFYLFHCLIFSWKDEDLYFTPIIYMDRINGWPGIKLCIVGEYLGRWWMFKSSWVEVNVNREKKKCNRSFPSLLTYWISSFL